MKASHCHCCSSGACPQIPSLPKSLFFAVIAFYLFCLGVDFGFYLPNLAQAITFGFLICWVILGYEIFLAMLFGFKYKNYFTENTLMMVASFGAWLIGQQAEGVAILLFYQLGAQLEEQIISKSKNSIKNLFAISTQKAKKIDANTIIEIPIEQIKKDDCLILHAGERIPVDCIITQGKSSIDNSPISGESLPLSVKQNDRLYAGGINLDGILHIQATKNYEDSTLNQIIRLIEEGSLQKSRSEKFITTFSRYYTPTVVILALLVTMIPSIYAGMMQEDFWDGFYQELGIWLQRGLIFLVVSCPCALVISIPLTFFAALGKASKEGILIKGSQFLETLSQVKSIIFDKTGTLTKGNLQIKQIIPYSHYSQTFILDLAILLETYSTHPIAKAITKHAHSSHTFKSLPLSLIKEHAGMGMSAQLDQKLIALGNLEFLKHLSPNLQTPKQEPSQCQIFVLYDDAIIGSILLEDQIKDESLHLARHLKQYGIKELYLLSGDQPHIVEAIAQQSGIKHYSAKLLPQDKVHHVKQILQANHAKRHKVAFVGDGINDAPALTLSDVGIAMGKNGSDIAIEGADVVLLNDDLNKIPKALSIAQNTKKILWQNILFALITKALIVILGTFGFANLWMALFGDVGVTLLALCNAIRAIK